MSLSAKEKKRLYDIEYRKKNAERLHKRMVEYTATHKTEKAEYDKKYREKHLVKISVYHATYYAKCREKVIERVHSYYELNTEKVKSRIANYTKLHRKEANARNLACIHIPLASKCETCGSERELERHHPDYNQPLVIQTLCTSCHRRLHENSPLLEHTHGKDGEMQ